MANSLITNATSPTIAVIKKKTISSLSNQSFIPPSSKTYCKEPMPMIRNIIPHQSILSGFFAPARLVT